MDENNNQKQPDLKIISLDISSNRDKEDTYSVEILTSAHTITYPKVKVAFGINQAIAFPIGFQVLNDNNEVMFNYTLNLNNSNQETQDE